MFRRNATKSRLHIFGSSHVTAVHHAFKEHRWSASLPIRISPRIRRKRPIDSLWTGLRLDLAEKTLLRQIARLGEQDHLVSMAGGNFYHKVSLLPNRVPFDFILPGDEGDIAPGAQLIPSRTMEAFFEARLRFAYEQLWLARARMRGTVYHLMAPPPKEDPAFIMGHSKVLRRSPEFRKNGIAPAALRLKCWRLQERVMRRLCAEHNIIFVPVPDGTQCPKGFLKPEYCNPDATHANMAYGKLVLQQIEQICAAPAKTA